MMRLKFCTLGCVFLLAAFSTYAQTAPPNAFNFQGRLAAANGNPVPDGIYSIRFRVYNAAAGGNSIAEQTLDNIAVKNGTFAVQLTNFAALTFNGNTWLGLSIGGNPELTPRPQIVSVPYAIKSNLALTVLDNSITTTKIANGAITGEKLAVGVFNGVAWQIGGNNITDPAAQYLGTSNEQALIFKTNNIERIRIGNDGRVGIGTTGPVAPLHVNGNLRATGKVAIGASASLSGETLVVDGSIKGLGSLRIEGATNFYGATNFQNSVTFSGTTNFPGTTVFGGNVGIGTATPTAKLHVQGNALFTTANIAEQLTVSGGATFSGSSTFNDSVVFGASANIEGGLSVGGFTNVSGGLFVGNTHNGFGDIRLWAYEGREQSGTAFIQARDNSTTSSINLTLRTKQGNTLKDNLVLLHDGRAGLNGVSYSNSDFSVPASHLTYAVSTGGKMIASQYVVQSDARLKEHIETVPDALSTLLALRGVTYDWNPHANNGVKGQVEKQYGFLAQEIEQVLPHLVQGGLNGYKAVNYQGIIPVTVEAIKMLNTRFATQQKEIDTLKARNAELEARLQRLEASLTKNEK